MTHRFRCLDPAYRGWCWAVTVARASRAKNVTVDESLLVPGDEAILAPDWVPWRERLLPGDLGVGDLLPAPPDDARLVPAALLEGDDGVADWGETAWAMPGTEPEDLVPVPSAEPFADDPDDITDAATDDLTGVAAVAVAAAGRRQRHRRHGRHRGPAAPGPGALGHRPGRRRAALVHQ